MSEQTKYKQLIDDMVWSYSRIGSYHSCPYKFFLTYLAEEETEKTDKFYATYGSFIHKLIELYYKGEIDKENLVTEFCLGFDENVAKAGRPKPNVVEKYITQGIEYFANFEPFPYNMVAVEEPVEFTIDGYKFRGIIDFLGEKDGELYIIDNKSRDLKPRSKRAKPTKDDQLLDEYLRQLYLYAEGVKQKFGKYPVALCFNCFKSHVFVKEQFNEQKLKDSISYVLESIHDIEKESEFGPNVDFFFCNYLCDFSHDCVYKELCDRR